MYQKASPKDLAAICFVLIDEEVNGFLFRSCYDSVLMDSCFR